MDATPEIKAVAEGADSRGDVGRPRAAARGAAEGPRHLRSARLRLTRRHEHRHLPAPSQRDRALLRPHRGADLGAAHVGRAGGPHPRHGARRPRPHARDAAVPGCPKTCRAAASWMPAAAPALAIEAAPPRRRGRGHRPVAYAGGAGAASACPSAGHGLRALLQRRHARPAARQLRPRGGDGLVDPLPRARRGGRAVAAGRAHAAIDRLHRRAAHAGDDRHAHRGQAVSAQ